MNRITTLDEHKHYETGIKITLVESKNVGQKHSAKFRVNNSSLFHPVGACPTPMLTSTDFRTYFLSFEKKIVGLNIVNHKHKWPCRIEFEAIKTEWNEIIFRHTNGTNWQHERKSTLKITELRCAVFFYCHYKLFTLCGTLRWLLNIQNNSSTLNKIQITVLMTVIHSNFKMMGPKNGLFMNNKKRNSKNGNESRTE